MNKKITKDTGPYPDTFGQARVITQGRRKKATVVTVPVFESTVASGPEAGLEKKIKQLGMKLILTDKLVNDAVDEVLVRTLQRLQQDSLVEALLNEGRRAVDTHHELERNGFLRATEFITVIDTLEDDRVPMLAHRAVKYAERVTAEMVRVNTFSLWKLVWLRLRRQPLVVYR